MEIKEGKAIRKDLSKAYSQATDLRKSAQELDREMKAIRIEMRTLMGKIGALSKKETLTQEDATNLKEAEKLVQGFFAKHTVSGESKEEVSEEEPALVE